MLAVERGAELVSVSGTKLLAFLQGLTSLLATAFTVGQNVESLLKDLLAKINEFVIFSLYCRYLI